DTLGAALLLSARPPGETLWTGLGDFPLPATERGFRIGFQASVPAASELGFDDVRFATAEPPDATAAEAAATLVGGAVTRGLEALASLDGRAPDFGNAITVLAVAEARIVEARTALDAIGTKEAKKASAKLAGVAKKLGKARQRAGDDQADAAVKLIG